ncbi:MAG: EAL domain-containing response regulator [Acidimicrobiales bacterium]
MRRPVTALVTSPGASPAAAPGRASARVLVIDDEPANVRLLVTLLGKAGFTDVRSTTDSRTAFDLITAFEPDLLLLDLHMPHVDGFEVLERLHALQRGRVPVPVLVLTADITTEARSRALSLGAKDFISKPFRLNELVMRIGNLVDARLIELELSREVSRMRSTLAAAPSEESHQRQLRESSRRIEDTLRHGDLFVAEQPIVDLTTASLIGFEALARFPNPPIQPPDVWFRQAHEVGLGVRLELAALDRALSDLRRLGGPLFVSINLSEATLRSPALLDALAGVDERRVVLELTESETVDDYDGLATVVAAVKERGVRIAADDTGSGFASFRHLLAVQPDFIKLDRSTIADIQHDPARRALAVALVSFARDIGATVIAEGIETAAELEAVSGAGITVAQGYYIGRPEPLGVGPIPLDHLTANHPSE